jgi:hypothetical protein
MNRVSSAAALCVMAGAGLALCAFSRRHRSSNKPMSDGWRIEAGKASLTGNLDDATLALRLGIAINAMRAAQRFYLATKDTPGPGGERDRFWSFLIAAGYLHEAINLLRPKFPQVRDLARAGDAPEELIREVGALMSGSVPFSKTIREMRDTLIFRMTNRSVTTRGSTTAIPSSGPTASARRRGNRSTVQPPMPSAIPSFRMVPPYRILRTRLPNVSGN